MKYFNDYDIQRARERFASRPVLNQATAHLQRRDPQPRARRDETVLRSEQMGVHLRGHLPVLRQQVPTKGRR